MARYVAIVDVYDMGPVQVMPLAFSTVAAPNVTKAHAAPEVVPLPQYVNEVGTPAVYVNVPSVLSVSPAGAVPTTLTP
jgi:hypothetical protein